ncbi:hypothetical protein GEO37_27665, partial [Klebsiella pneumoniae]|nr:hypothetical protein [Klebsiella pneumoniae]
LISESAWEEMTCLFAPSLANESGNLIIAQLIFVLPMKLGLVIQTRKRNEGCIVHCWQISYIRSSKRVVQARLSRSYLYRLSSL